MAKVRKDLRWEDRAKEFSSLNTREAETNTLVTEITQVSNMSFEELGALKKINGNEVVSNFDFQDINSTNKTIEYTYTSAGTYNIVLEASATNIVIQELIMIGGGGCGGRTQYKNGNYKGLDGGDTTVTKGGATLYSVTGGTGGNSAFLYYNFVSGGGGGSGGINTWTNETIASTGTFIITVGAGGNGEEAYISGGQADGGAGGDPNGYAGGSGCFSDNNNFNYPGGGGGGLAGNGADGYLTTGWPFIAGGAANGTYGGAGGSTGSGGTQNGTVYGGGGAGAGTYATTPGRGADGYCYIRINYDY